MSTSVSCWEEQLTTQDTLKNLKRFANTFPRLWKKACLASTYSQHRERLWKSARNCIRSENLLPLKDMQNGSIISIIPAFFRWLIRRLNNWFVCCRWLKFLCFSRGNFKLNELTSLARDCFDAKSPCRMGQDQRFYGYRNLKFWPGHVLFRLTFFLAFLITLT
jgi:hypothetical protein